MDHRKGGLRNVVGFTSLGKNIGIKPSNKDFAVLYSDSICTTAAVYTSNLIQGAPLKVTKQHLSNSKAQVVVVNSGIANVATGDQGVKNAIQTAELVADELAVDAEDVLVASTGVIGPQVPMDKIRSGIVGLKNELRADGEFAEAILTTDTRKKEICISTHGFTIAGCAKGSGMISPNMATMLAFLTTDADISSEDLSSTLKSAVKSSFNMMSVDMDTSTSDMVIVMANNTVKADISEFKLALEYVCKELAKMIARDGEGATKLIICEALGASSQLDADKVSKSIVTSNLVKTAIYGNDPNWGRLMMALGNSKVQHIDQAKIGIAINNTEIVKDGVATSDYDPASLSKLLSGSQEIKITIQLNQGDYSSEAYGCDMSEDYIKINAEYTT